MPLNNKQVIENEANSPEVLYYKLVDSMRGFYQSNTINLYIIFACYILYKLAKSDHKGILVYDLIFTVNLGIEPSVLQVIYNTYNKNAFEKSIEILSGNKPEVFAEIIEDYAIKGYTRGSGYRADHSTPEAMVALASRILNIQDNENIADICSGNGDFLCKAIRRKPNANYVGYEINMQSVAISKIRADLLGHKLNMEVGDAIVNLENNPNAKYDKIFCNYPFGMRIFGDMQPNTKYDHLLKNNRYDWLFNTLLCSHLSADGRGVSIAATGSLWNAIDREARKYFVDNGYIEAIISLPGGVFNPVTGIETALIIFGKNNKSVRFINAFNYQGLINTQDDTDDHKRMVRYEIDKIMSLIGSDVEGVSISVDNSIIKENNYDLSFKAYYSNLPNYENGDKLANVAEILRGSIITKNITEEETGNCVLKLSDIQGAIVGNELDFINENDTEKSFNLEAGDIIVSRTLNPIKVALFTGNSKNRVYPSGNLFVLRARNIDPYYLLSFLISDEGRKALEFAATGTALKVLSASSLGDIKFPKLEQNEQNTIATNLKAALMEVSTYEYKLTQAKDKLRNSFYERSGH